MENENDKNYLDERKKSDENNPPNLDPENEIESGPKRELLDSSDDTEELKNESNEVLDMMEKKKRKDMTIPIILVVVFLIIATVVGLYLLKDKDVPIIGEGAGPQQKILNSSMIAMSDVESYSFEGDFNLDFTKDDEEGFSLAMEFDGQADESDADNIKGSFNAKPEIAIATEGGSEDISFDFSMKSFGKIGEETAYLKLNDFDLGMAGMIFGEMIVPYKDKWYSLNMKELRKESGSPLENSDLDFEKMIEEIKDLLKKYEMIQFQKDLGDTKINDQEVYHYQVGIDSEAALDFYVELLKTSPFLASEITNNELENIETELEENREEILVVLNEILTNVEIEVWIGKENKMIYRIAMSGKFDEEFMKRMEEKMEKIEEDKYSSSDIYNKLLFTNVAMADWTTPPSSSPSSVPISYKSQPFDMSFDVSITMSNFNQPISISRPEKSEDLMKVLEEAMAGFMNVGINPSTVSINPNNDSDQDGLNDEMETIYGTDPNNPDTDGDGFSDGNEVSRGYDPLLPGEAKLDYDRLFKY